MDLSRDVLRGWAHQSARNDGNSVFCTTLILLRANSGTPSGSPALNCLGEWQTPVCCRASAAIRRGMSYKAQKYIALRRHHDCVRMYTNHVMGVTILPYTSLKVYMLPYCNSRCMHEEKLKGGGEGRLAFGFSKRRRLIPGLSVVRTAQAARSTRLCAWALTCHSRFDNKWV